MIRTNMSPMSIIVAVDECGGFGKDGKIPWANKSFGKEDLKRFKEITSGGVCIMGRNTYDDMLAMKRTKKPKQILPKRESYVVTSRGGETPGAEKVLSIREAVQNLDSADKREVFILGGRRIFLEALPWVNKVYMTVIKGDCYNCDLKFPVDYVHKNFTITEGSRTDDLYYVTYQRR